LAGWLPTEVIEAAVDGGVVSRPPQKRFKYVSHCDPSGGAHDSFTCAVAHLENDIAILDCVVEVRSPFNPSEATATIAGTLREFGLRQTIGDAYAAQWVVDAFAREGIDYRHSERNRSEIYLDAMAMFNSGRVRLVDNKRLLVQLANLVRKVSPSGRDRVDHPAGGFDDLSVSAAGALIQLTHKDWSSPGTVWWEMFQRERNDWQANLDAPGHPKGAAEKITREWAKGTVEYTKFMAGEIGPPV
jgi:hypothetical protein